MTGAGGSNVNDTTISSAKAIRTLIRMAARWAVEGMVGGGGASPPTCKFDLRHLTGAQQPRREARIVIFQSDDQIGCLGIGRLARVGRRGDRVAAGVRVVEADQLQPAPLQPHQRGGERALVHEIAVQRLGGGVRDRDDFGGTVALPGDQPAGFVRQLSARVGDDLLCLCRAQPHHSSASGTLNSTIRRSCGGLRDS